MRRPLLVLLALLPASLVSSGAPAAPAAYPGGKVVYRPECFSQLMQEEAQNMPMGGATGYYSGPSNPKPVVTTPLPPAAPPPPPAFEMSDELSAAPGTDSGGDGGGRFQLPSVLPKKKAPSAQPPAKSAPAAEFEPAPEPMKAAERKMDEGGQVKDMKELERNFDADDRATSEVAPRGPVLDWGATVFLSNDDSMSLASAQRLLYAAMNRLPFDVSQIRPHELLNYFSFDAVTPTADQTFDVLASAEANGDQLSVALAVKGATPPRQDLDLTLVVDRSCSMADEGRMDYTKRGLNLMAEQLRTGDRLDVVLFDDQVCVPLENYVVGRDDPNLLQQTIAQLQPEGSTDVGLGLRKAYDVAQGHLDTHGRNRRVMIVTDAMMNTGDVDPNTVSEIGRAYEEDDIRLTGVGVGREFDDHVLDMLTEKGKGAYVFLGSEAVVDRVFGETGFDQLTQTVAHDVHFALKLPPSLAMKRFYGEEASTVMEEVQPINYFAGTTQLFLQDLQLKGGKPTRSDPVELQISYRDARTGEPETRTFRTTVGAMIDADPHNVRKGLALMAWTDVLTAHAMGADACGAPLQTYASRAARVQDDAEIAFVNGLVRDACGEFDLPALVSNRGVPFKVRVDSDIPVSEVAIACAGTRSAESLTGSDVIAMFTVTPGVCELTLSGTVDMTAQVEVPTTGGDLRCLVRGGRLSCS
ncbi:MAG: VWA domain-containing protein [Myxococcota bacterium]